MGEVSNSSSFERYGAITATGAGMLVTSVALGVLYRHMSDTCRALLIGSTAFLGGATAWQVYRLRSPSLEEFEFPSEVWPAGFEALQAAVAELGDRAPVAHAHDHHALHDRLMALAGRVDDYAYTQLLDSLDGKTVVYPNGYSVRFSTEMERRRMMRGDKPEIRFEHLDEVTDGLVALEQECFSTPYSRAYMERRLSSGAKFLAARDEDDQLVGIAIYSVKKGEICIESIGRSAPYARLGIGRGLMQRALEAAREQEVHSAKLTVRESNAAARRLYEAFGFVQSAPARQRYYEVPNEAGIPMRAEIGYACLIGRLDAVLGQLKRGEAAAFEGIGDGIEQIMAKEPFHHHVLCDRLAQITRLVPKAQREEWRAVLDKLDGLEITYANSTEVKLDVSLLGGEKPQLDFEQLEALTDDDLDDLTTIQALCFTAVRHTRDELRSSLEEGREQFLVARHEGRIVGWFSYEVEGEVFEVTRLARLPQYSGLGVLDRFKEMLLAQAATLGVGEVRCDVRAGNSAAISLYKRAGLTVQGRKPSAYRFPVEDALVMGADVKMVD